MVEESAFVFFAINFFMFTFVTVFGLMKLIDYLVDFVEFSHFV